MSGKFIVFEGIDGAGKSTQVSMLCQRLSEMGRSVVLSAEPTEYESGRLIRQALSGREKKSECQLACMFVLDRIAHNIHPTEGIIALTEGGKDVISDRYYYSTLAYQGQTTDYEWTKTMNVSCPEIKRPDLCIYLDLTPEESLERIAKRGEALEIYENTEKLTKVREAFMNVIADLRAEGEKIFVVKANRTPKEISDEIFEIVRENLF